MSLLPTLRYLRHLPPTMVLGKAAHTLREKLLQRFPPPASCIRAEDGPFFQSHNMSGFADSYRCAGDRFREAAAIWDGKFFTKEVGWDFGSDRSMDWLLRFEGQGERVNWNYDWCAFSHAIALVSCDASRAVKTIAGLVQRMEQVHPIGSEARTLVWEPIVVALRIMGLSVAANLASRAGVDDPSSMFVLARHVDYCHKALTALCETYLGYNHAAFGISGILVADLALNRQATPFAHKAAARVFASQVLPDGFHAERSPTYHIHVLLLLRSLLHSNILPVGDVPFLEALEAKMVVALHTVVHPDGEIAILNDSAIGDSVPPAKVGWCPARSRTSVSVLPDAGYVALQNDGASIIFDAGPLGPPENCGHGHADFLSIEASVRKQRVIVDPGVFSTSKGELRDRTRSAQTHNGPSYLGLEPAEFFGAWRVGRRGTAWFEKDLPALLPCEAAGAADGYARFGGMVVRYVGMTANGGMVIGDLWKDAPGLEPHLSFLIAEPWEVVVSSTEQLELHDKQQPETRLRIQIMAGTLAEVDSDAWSPQGPMLPQTGTRFSIVPQDRRFACLSLGSTDAHAQEPLPPISAIHAYLADRLAANSTCKKLRK